MIQRIKIKQKERILLSGAILLLGIQSFIFVSYTFFLHTHTLQDGTVVVHSHPFSSGEDRDHEHDASVFHIIPDLTNYVSYQSDGCSFVVHRSVPFTLLTQGVFIPPTKRNVDHRGPPLG